MSPSEGPRVSPPDRIQLVLASGSRYRERLLTEAGYAITVDVPDIDERSADPLLAERGPEGLALELARRKARAVAPRHRTAVVLAADQLGVVGEGSCSTMLTKAPDVEAAVAQLMSISGTTHHLVNGVVVLDASSGVLVEGVDICEVEMRPFTMVEARRYAQRFEPFDTSGSYRLEDGALMEGDGAFVTAVRAEHDSCVLGMPMPLVRRLLGQVGRRA